MQTFLSYISSLRADESIQPSSGYMPNKPLAGSSTACFYDLPPVIRALLIADGTVTMAIEAVYKEPVNVITQHQQFLSLSEPIPLLGLAAGEGVLYRNVILKGAHSNKEYVEAHSILKQSSIDGELWQRLVNKEVGMGVVLRNFSKASYREVLHFGVGDLNHSVEGSVHRSYRVTLAGESAILITEVFNLDAFKDGYK